MIRNEPAPLVEANECRCHSTMLSNFTEKLHDLTWMLVVKILWRKQSENSESQESHCQNLKEKVGE